MENINKKIVLVIPTFSIGGMERIMSELAKYFNTKGHEVHVLFLIDHKPFYKVDENIKLYYPKINKEVSDSRGILYWLKVIRYIRKTIKTIKPDTVFAIPQGYSNLTVLSLLGTSIPVYISDRNSPNKPVPFKSRVLRKIFYPLANGIIAQTEFAKENLIRSGINNKNIEVIPNPLKIINYYKRESDKLTIINIGRFVMEKNQKELIDIFSKTDNEDWQLKIIGSGPLKKSLEAQINKLGLENKVFLIEPVSNVDKEMSQADIFAFTSIYEGFPNSLSEALGYPLACISYDCIAGPKEMILDGTNGYLVQKDNQKEYIQKLNDMMHNKAKREFFQQEAKHHKEKFSMQKIGDRYLKFLLMP